MKLKLIYLLLTLCGIMSISACHPDKKQGCTDPASLNYDPTAEEDDGSCQYPEWKPTGVMNGGQIFCITPKGSNIFVGTEVGVFLSTDSGDSWKAVNNGLGAPLVVFSIATDGFGIFAATEFGIYRTTNNGGIWTAVYADDAVYSVTFIGSSILAGTESGGILRSTDNGNTWKPINTGYNSYYATWTIAVDGDYVYTGQPYAYPNFNVSNNKGNNWTSFYIPGDVYALATMGSTVFAGTEGGGIFTSTDHGSHWTDSNHGLLDTDVYALMVNETTIYAGTYEKGVYKSDDNGKTWIAYNEKIKPGIVNALAVSDGFIYAAIETGVFQRPL